MGPSRGKVRVYADELSLARAAAALFVERFEKSVAEKGFFSVLLSGGTTPLALYALLSSKEFSGMVDWRKVHLFWGDERCVPPDSPESNFNSALAALVSKIDIPHKNVHRIKGELVPEDAAKIYEDELTGFFGLVPGASPLFDLAFLGLGKDGHTLSLFPGTRALDESARLVVANHVPEFDAWRVTLTFKAIEKAKKIVFLVAGAEKAAVLKEVFEGKDYPAGRVKGQEVVWLVDREASRLVKE